MARSYFFLFCQQIRETNFTFCLYSSVLTFVAAFDCLLARARAMLQFNYRLQFAKPQEWFQFTASSLTS